MKIEVITSYYREEFLAPLFCLHYEPWVDRMTFVADVQEKFDVFEQADRINEAIARSTADWVVVVDTDEFVFPLPLGAFPRAVLAEANYDLVYSEMLRVWRHRDDVDINRMQPPLYQRRHGQKDHIKPAVFRPRGVRLTFGNHAVEKMPDGFRIGPAWSGSHWANADVCFWITRETRDRGPRLGQKCIDLKLGTHSMRTREQIMAEAEQHVDDPIVIA